MCRQRHLGGHPFRCMAPCRSTRIVRERAKSSPCSRMTMRFIARAPKNRRFRLRSRCVPCLRAMRDLSNVCYVDVRAVWRHVYRVVSGIWADTISDAWPHVGRRGSSAKSSPCSRMTMHSIARAPKNRRFRLRSRRVPCLRARRDLSNVCYVDVRAVWWHVSRVVSGIWADAISDAWPHVG